MTKSLKCRVARIAAGMAVVGVFAGAPVAAQADTTTATGTLTGGALSETAPAFTAFTAALTGVTRTVPAAMGAWTINNATGSVAAYHVTVAAGVPTIGGTALTAAELASMGSTFLTMTTANAVTPAASNPAPASTAPVGTAGTVNLDGTAATIYSAAASTGAGQWDIAADTTGNSLGVVIPGDAPAGAYSDVLTYTAAAGA